MGSIIAIMGFFAILFLILKKFALYTWEHEKGKFLFIRVWFHWLEYIYIFIAAVIAPKHTINEGIITLTVVILIKIIFDKFKILDVYFEKRFGKFEE